MTSAFSYFYSLTHAPPPLLVHPLAPPLVVANAIRYVRDWLRQYPETLLVDAFCMVTASAFQLHVPNVVQHTILEGYFGVVLPAGFVNHAGMVGLGMSLHFEFFINSWCHSWAMPPSKAEQQKLREDQASAKSKALAAAAAGLALGDDFGELDVHGSKQTAAWEPCKGTNHHWVGLLNAGEGYHAGHHEDGKLAQHGTYWWQDTTYMGICVLEALGIVWDVKRKGGEHDGGASKAGKGGGAAVKKGGAAAGAAAFEAAAAKKAA